MSDDQPKKVLVTLTPSLAVATLRAAHERGLSRSAWLRQVIERELSRAGTGGNTS